MDIEKTFDNKKGFMKNTEEHRYSNKNNKNNLESVKRKYKNSENKQ